MLSLFVGLSVRLSHCVETVGQIIRRFSLSQYYLSFLLLNNVTNGAALIVDAKYRVRH